MPGLRQAHVVLAIGLFACADATGIDGVGRVVGEYEEVEVEGSFLIVPGICEDPRFLPDVTREGSLSLRADRTVAIVFTNVAHCPEGDILTTSTSTGTYTVTGSDIRLDIEVGPLMGPLMGEVRRDGSIRIEFGLPEIGAPIGIIFRRR